MSYGFHRVVDLSVEDAIEKVTAELSEEGFGVLTSIDVKNTLKQKLDEDVRPYTILGACNPQIAYRALQAETELGLLLPCNVIVYENDEKQTVVAAVDARRMLSVVENPELDGAAEEVSRRLQSALGRL